jgi:hypothetical protein
LNREAGNQQTEEGEEWVIKEADEEEESWETEEEGD